MGRQKMQFVPLFERTAEVGEMGRRGGGSGRVALDLREPALWLKRNPRDQKVGAMRSVPTMEVFYSTFRYKFATEAYPFSETGDRGVARAALCLG